MPRSSRDEEFSVFVQTRRTALVRSACLLTAGDTHLAEDLVQTALARLYVAWPRVRRAGTESAYVWRIIVNAHIDEVRRPGRRRERHVPELPEPPAPPETFPDGLGGGEVRAALAALPPRMRAAVVLRHWLDLSVEETAELLNCSEGTVKSQTAKAAARLRDLMLQSRDATAPPADRASQPVNGRPGKFDVQGDTQILTFQIVGGQWVGVQAPVSLGWDSAELAKFASGVQVLVIAQQGRG